MILCYAMVRYVMLWYDMVWYAMLCQVNLLLASRFLALNLARHATPTMLCVASVHPSCNGCRSQAASVFLSAAALAIYCSCLAVNWAWQARHPPLPPTRSRLAHTAGAVPHICGPLTRQVRYVSWLWLHRHSLAIYVYLLLIRRVVFGVSTPWCSSLPPVRNTVGKVVR